MVDSTRSPQAHTELTQWTSGPREEQPVHLSTGPLGAEQLPPPKKSGGYVHHRTRKEAYKEGRSLGIPEVALKHWRLLKDGIKPTREGFLATEELITKVKAERAAGQDPAPLWAPYMPLPLLTNP